MFKNITFFITSLSYLKFIYIYIKIRVCQPFKTLYSPYSKQLFTWYSSRLLGLQNLFSLPHLHPPQLFPELIVFSTWTFSVIVYNFCSTLNIDTYPIGHFGNISLNARPFLFEVPFWVYFIDYLFQLITECAFISTFCLFVFSLCWKF